VKGKIIVFGLILMASELCAQPFLLTDFLQTSPDFNQTEVARQKIQAHLADLTSRMAKADDDRASLQLVFQKTQQRFLKRYQPHTDVARLFENGVYDCLTATALFSIILEELDFRYDIIETNYHIFLMVKTTRGDVLLETTDPYHGFVSKPEQIQERIATYRNANTAPRVSSRAVHYPFSFDLYRVVEPRNLTGLLWYNRAVVAFNRADWEASVAYLLRANAVYASLRVSELAELLHVAIRESELTPAVREQRLNDLDLLTTRHVVAASLR
jgi:hypothetical protein